MWRWPLMAASPRINCASLGFWPLLQSRTFCSRLLCHLHRWWKSCLRSEDQELFQERLSEHQIQDNRVDHARTIYAENASLGHRPRFVAATTSSIKTLVPASKPHQICRYIYIYAKMWKHGHRRMLALRDYLVSIHKWLHVTTIDMAMGLSTG